MPSTHVLTDRERPSSRNLLSYLLLVLCAVWCIYWFVHAWNYWEDDAYIHLEFARSVAAGHGFAFNGRVVAGDTAPLWVLLLAGAHIFIHNWIVAGKILTVFGAVFGFAGIYAFARNLAAPLPDRKIFPAAMLLLIAVNPYTCYWIFSGMETIAAAGLACFAVLAATRRQPGTASFLTGCLLSGLAPLLRPEMIFLTALLALALSAQAFRLRTPTATFRYATWIAGVFLLTAPLLLWSLYSLHAFGHVIPNTNAAKRAAADESVVRRLISIYAAAFPLIMCGLLAGVGLVLSRFSAVRQSLRNEVASAFRPPPGSPPTFPGLPLAGWIFFLWTGISTAFYIANHTYVQTRYILVTAPALTIIVLSLFLHISRRCGRTLYLAGFLAAVSVSLIITQPFIANKALNCQVTQTLAAYLHSAIPPDAPVASYSIGELAFLSEHPLVDTGGITRPEAVAYAGKSQDGVAHWARRAGARYYLADRSPMPGSTAVFTVDSPYLGWTFHRSRYATSTRVSLWKLPDETPLSPNPFASAP